MARMPARAYAGDAGLDIRTLRLMSIKPGERELVSTGIAMAIPEGYAGFLQPRSGLANEYGLSIVNTPGLIDSHYRGEIKVNLINHGNKTVMLYPGQRIAQMVIMRVPDVNLVEVDSLDDTDRGTGGFGSSGIE